MAHFAVMLVHGPGWDVTCRIRGQDAWDKHAAFMDGLVDDGFIILGDGERTPHVVEASDEQENQGRLSKDSCVEGHAPGRRDRVLGAMARRPGKASLRADEPSYPGLQLDSGMTARR